ncbi:MAG: voltage-gated chloride channel family protein [Oligoflexia bacterium]|nr:voltage-gated chloride channel family protein [Oligoflexia bacterium]
MIRQLLRWLAIAGTVGVLAGCASAFFLISLDWVTRFREAHLFVIALLPLCGLIIGLVYHRYGRKIEGGSNLILDEIHEPSETIPLRMMPLVLWGTLMTHLFGGSAGREGTAIQMGASLADQLAIPFRLRFDTQDRRILLHAGMSAGFASVFGTPLAGTVFGLEVITTGRMKYDALLPCLLASIIGNKVTLAWGVHHTAYAIHGPQAMTIAALAWSMLAGALFGIVGMLFARATHMISSLFKKHVAFPPFRPFIGGIIVAIGVYLVGSTRYIGLGIPTIVESFQKSLPPWDFAGKFAFTALTLGAGFKGGEVTPLFYIGAALGSTLSHVIPLAPDLLAGMGLVAVFAGAANVPIASSLMAVELFGDKAAPFAAIACVLSYFFSGHPGIYRSQRRGENKLKII